MSADQVSGNLAATLSTQQDPREGARAVESIGVQNAAPKSAAAKNEKAGV